MGPAQRRIGELGRLPHLRRIGDYIAVYGPRPASSKADADMRSGGDRHLAGMSSGKRGTESLAHALPFRRSECRPERELPIKPARVVRNPVG
jgi:hypothetical protein